VTGRDTELLDIGVFVIRKFRRVGVRDSESVVPDFVDPWIFPSSRCFVGFSG
jgi:hypothetical protein